MKDLTMLGRMQKATKRHQEVILMVTGMKNGEDVDFNKLTDLLLDMHNDEINLIIEVHELDSNFLFKPDDGEEIEVPEFARGRA